MAFKFRLEKVLEYRKQLEEQAMLALAKAQAARDAEIAKLESLKHELVVQLEKSRNAAAMSGAERWLAQTYVLALRQDINQSTNFLVSLEQEVDQCRGELVTRAQERELLEKLKSKQAKRFAEEEKLREQRDYDETATIRHNKKEAV